MALPSYAPRLRTALVFCGTGTAGAYHAGVLRALSEAGIKIDVLAAHGAGGIAAVSGASDNSADLWSSSGPWATDRMRRAYRWRASLRTCGWGVLTAAALLLAPLAVLIVATGVYGASVVATLINLPSIGEWLVSAYQRLLAFLFAPPILPTIIPRAVVLAVLVVVVVLAAAAIGARRRETSRRRVHGAVWWRVFGQPLDPREPEATVMQALRRVTPAPPGSTDREMSNRFVELLTENFGQPGFREVILGVHDLDARRDVVAAVLAPQWRQAFGQRRVGAGPRESEAVDLASGGAEERGLALDFVLAGLRLPAASAPHEVTFPDKSYWQGETHRWCDRPELVGRLIDELARVGVEQVILTGAAPPAATPHDMRPRALDLRTRMGETLRSVETAAFQDAWAAAVGRFSGVFTIRPGHNPLGPFDFGGVYDESSDRMRTVAELMQQGHDDAYRQFIEPVVATGERLADI
ncbi:MAG: hypothetical protein HQ485_15100 [Acidobacteria bacterium]|nr:hypothetical protein [Acidobacteriota bacterium]